jgi:ABC-type uncharacterized transport system auxiliary subunit
MTRLVLAILVAAALSGCLGSAPPVPRDHFYRIRVATPPGAVKRHLPGVVSVRPLEADGLLRERPLVFGAKGRPHEMQQHDYHYWTDPPPRMLQGQLVDYLRHSGVARTVVTPDLRIRPDFEVLGRIKRLERLLGGGAPLVSVELELGLIGRAEDRLLVLDSYAVDVPAEDTSIESSVTALNLAVAEIFGRFLADARRSSVAIGSVSR